MQPLSLLRKQHWGRKVGAHARFFGPSSLHRRIACPASRALEEGLANYETYAARAGSAAHRLAEICYQNGEHTRNYIGEKWPDYPDLGSVSVTDADNVQLYLDVIAAQDDDTKFIERKVSYAAFVEREAPAVAAQMGASAKALVASESFAELLREDFFGYSDYIGLSEQWRSIKVVDYKNGVYSVRAEGNPQVYCYALAAAETYDWVTDLRYAQMCIVQPNARFADPDHPGVDWTAPMDLTEVYQWGREVLVPAIIRSLLPNPAFNASGDGQCKYCRAKGVCSAYAKWAQEEAEEAFRDITVLDPEVDLPPAAQMTHTQIERVLRWQQRLVPWMEAVAEYAEELATLEGVEYAGHKVVRKRTNWRWTDAAAANKALSERLPDEVRLNPPTLRTPTQIKEALKAGWTDPVFLRYAEQPVGSLALRPLSAKGEAVDVKRILSASAEDAFSDV